MTGDAGADPVRIALVAPPWLPVPPPSYGGTETIVDLLARGLAAAGHDVVLWTTGDSTCPVPRAWTYESAQGARMGETAVELRHVVAASTALADLDVVHHHSAIGSALAAAAIDRRAVVTVHGPFDADAAPVYRSIGRDVPIIAISRAHARSAHDVPIAHVIRHGVEPERYPFGCGDGGYVAFLGRMDPTKGVDRAARAARSAGVPLRIAAKMRLPSERAYFDEVVRPLLGDGVEYLGELGFADKVALLAGARALLNPIRWDEPFGMVMIEALACGTPVVGSPCGSTPEIVDDGGTGFVCTTDRELAERLGQVGTLDRAACRRAVVDRFSATRVVAEHLEVYREVAARAADRFPSTQGA